MKDFPFVAPEKLVQSYIEIETRFLDSFSRIKKELFVKHSEEAVKVIEEIYKKKNIKFLSVKDALEWSQVLKKEKIEDQDRAPKLLEV